MFDLSRLPRRLSVLSLALIAFHIAGCASPQPQQDKKVDREKLASVNTKLKLSQDLFVGQKFRQSQQIARLALEEAKLV